MRTGFIGAGNMAQAIIGGLIRTGTPAENISIYEPNSELVDRLTSRLGIQAVNENTAIFENCDAVMLVTEWNEFRELDLERLKRLMKGDVFVDCRNVYKRDRVESFGINYQSFGRGSRKQE